MKPTPANPNKSPPHPPDHPNLATAPFCHRRKALAQSGYA